MSEWLSDIGLGIIYAASSEGCYKLTMSIAAVQIRCVEEVNARGWNEEGIYRVPGYLATFALVFCSVDLFFFSAL